MNGPSFFILGAAKAGTTTLFDILKQHPQVFLPYEKEPMYYSRDDYYKKGERWYKRSYFRNSENYTVRGEATPHYLYWAEKIAPRIRNAYSDGEVKFIVILRDPVQRAYSWYWNMVADGKEDLPFLDALKKEDTRIRDNWQNLNYYGAMRYGYYRGGCYAEQLQYYFQQGFSREKFLFLLQDDLIQDQTAVAKALFNFLDVESDIEVSHVKSNVVSMPRYPSLQKLLKSATIWSDSIKPYIPAYYRFKLKMSLLMSHRQAFHYPEMSVEAREYLMERYALQTEPISQLIGRDLSVWNSYR